MNPLVLILRSLLNVMKKELSQTLRDRRMLGTLLVAPVLQLVVFGYAIDLDVDRIPTVVCDQDHTPQSRALTQRVFCRSYISPACGPCGSECHANRARLRRCCRSDHHS